MPINEVEIHPYLKIGERISSNKMIIGTFPVYSLTRPHNLLKAQFRNGSIPFFYGSIQNQFWSYYRTYVDNTVNILSNKSILDSLKRNEIAISDIVNSCCRRNYSPLDKDLLRIVWNNNIANIIEVNTNKVLCTSKAIPGSMGWLFKYILAPAGFKVDLQKSNALHQRIIGANQNPNMAVNNIAFVLSKNNKEVSIVAIPSPAGTGKRSLKHFGYIKGVHNINIYLDNYLQAAFNWFL